MTSQSTTEASPLTSLRHVERTDIGMRREENQDAYGVIEIGLLRLFAVADGMGGVKGGAVASGLALSVLKEELGKKTDIKPDDIRDALINANSKIFERGASDPLIAGMGTTFVGLAFIDANLYIVNVGDSRAYRIRRDRIRQMTDDHTLVQELLRSGTINQDQAHNHPVSHMLTRSLGPTAEVQVDCRLCEDGPARGDIYILCSDGLYNMVSDKEMLAIVTEMPLKDAVERLVILANERGGTDNITVIVIEVGDDFPKGAEDFPAEEEGTGLNGEGEGPDLWTLTPEVDSETKSVEESNGTPGQETPEDIQIENKEVASALNLELLRDRFKPTDSAEPEREIEAVKQEAEPQEEAPPLIDPEKLRQVVAQYAKPVIVTALLIATALAGAYLTPYIKTALESKPETLVAPKKPVEPDVMVAGVPLVPPLKEHGSKSLVLPPDLQPQPVGMVKRDSAETGSGDAQTDNIVRRKALLRSVIQALDEKIAGGGGVTATGQGATKSEAQLLQAKLDDLRAEIDAASRKLAVWYGRRARLQETDPVNLAAEVAVSAESVRQKKEAFELTTWSYLKESDVLRYNPDDSNQKAKVEDLIKSRKERMSELSTEIRKAIDQAVGEADQKIAELTLERDRVEAKLLALNREGGSEHNTLPVNVTNKDELSREREIAQSELNELLKLVPE